jgi:(E)-4-hydroxy-3-methylbut-2-enyl-diphosphate synthase
MMVAESFEKIRVNPGNFADGRKTFEVINYDDPKQFEEERAYIEEVKTLTGHSKQCGHIS